MNAATAPTPASPERSAATSAPRSKSAVCTTTRGAFISAAGDRWEERQLGAFADERGFVAQHLVQRAAQGLAPRQRARMHAAARDQRIAHRADAAAFGELDHLARAERLADRRKVTHRELHDSNSANVMKSTRSPFAMAWPLGLSTTPSPQTTEVITPELWFGNRSSPPASLRRTRRNSRRLSGAGQSKSARCRLRLGVNAVAPCRRSSTGRTTAKKVRKLDTGLPGSPIT